MLVDLNLLTEGKYEARASDLMEAFRLLIQTTGVWRTRPGYRPWPITAFSCMSGKTWE